MPSASSVSHRPVLISVMQFEDSLKARSRTVFDVIDAAHRLGADGVELRRELWPNWQTELTTAREKIEALGLLVTYATHITLFSEDESGQDLLRQDIAAASTLSSPILRVFQGPAPADNADSRWDAARRVIDYAATQNVVVALENYVGMPGGKLHEIKRVLDLVPGAALGTNIDIGNYAQHEQDLIEAIDTIGNRAVYAHIKDKTAITGDPPIHLGAGVLPLRTILAALDQLPQQFPYCFEFRGGDDPEAHIEQSLAYLRGRE